MKLLINNEEISVTLEGEQTVGEVFKNISEQFIDLDKTISGIRVDGRYSNLSSVKSLNLEKVEEIHFDVVSRGQLLLDSVIAISNYLSRAMDFLEERPQYKNISDLKEKEKQNLKEGIRWLDESLKVIAEHDPRIIEIIGSQVNQGNGNGKHGFQDKFEFYLGSLENSASEKELSTAMISDFYKSLKFGTDNLLALLRTSAPNDENIIALISEFLSTIDSISEKLSRITGLLHEGKDGDAYSLVSEAVTGLELYLQLIPILEQTGITRQIKIESEVADNLFELNKELLSHLHSLADAMENQDSVSISDICEYEIPEVLELLPDALGQIKSHFN